MNTKEKLNADILEITLKIQENYPELSKYIEEMRITIPDEKHPKISQASLEAYYESLKSMLAKYISEHSEK